MLKTLLIDACFYVCVYEIQGIFLCSYDNALCVSLENHILIRKRINFELSHPFVYLYIHLITIYCCQHNYNRI